MMPPGLGWILVYDAGSYCCTDRQWKRQPGTLEALNGKQAKQRVAMWDIPHRYSSGMSKCFTMAHTFSQFTLSLSHAGQDNERESDDDAHMGDDPGAAGANSNGSTDQALRSAWEHDLPPGTFVTGNESLPDGEGLSALGRLARAAIGGQTCDYARHNHPWAKASMAALLASPGAFFTLNIPPEVVAVRLSIVAPPTVTPS
ncbi:hypothetical protein Q7P35_004724 [Cladosporium inversicolor]